MQPDLLQQLRDVHVPAEPGWWPPAPGWWLLALAMAVLSGVLLRTAWRWWRRAAPVRQARALHAALARQLYAAELDDRAYADACNELLKRLFVHGLRLPDTGPLADDRWLAVLDGVLGEPAFSQGPGRALGESRFRRDAAIDGRALEPLVRRLLQRVGPTRGAPASGRPAPSP
jgi:hypothetical protein